MRLVTRGLRAAVAVMMALGAAACSRDVAGPRDPADARSVGSYTLPEIDVHTCRYGGTYPFCQSAPAPGGPDMQNPTEPSEPPGGASGPDSTASCDPLNDPNCEKPLTAADSTVIIRALANHVRPDSTIADTTNRRKCRQMYDRFMQAWRDNVVFRGGSDMTAPDGHYGATLNGRIHFDPWLLNGAAGGNASDIQELANTALHEAAHLLGAQHPGGPDAYGVYTQDYFNLLPPGSGPCIR